MVGLAASSWRPFGRSSLACASMSQRRAKGGEKGAKQLIGTMSKSVHPNPSSSTRDTRKHTRKRTGKRAGKHTRRCPQARQSKASDEPSNEVATFQAPLFEQCQRLERGSRRFTRQRQVPASIGRQTIGKRQSSAGHISFNLRPSSSTGPHLAPCSSPPATETGVSSRPSNEQRAASDEATPLSPFEVGLRRF